MEKEATNHMIRPMKATAAVKDLNDIAFRLILIPFFGIVIPLITRMTQNTSLSHWQLKLSFLYTIFIAFVVWQGNRYLLFTLRTYFNWFRKPVRKIIALLLAISFYTLPVSSLLLVGWYHLFARGIVGRQRGGDRQRHVGAGAWFGSWRLLALARPCLRHFRP